MKIEFKEKRFCDRSGNRYRIDRYYLFMLV